MTTPGHRRWPPRTTGTGEALDLDGAVRRIAAARRAVSAARAVLVAITGIDGAGKGHVATQIAAALAALGVRTATLNVDAWLNLPRRRFRDVDPAGHFYRHAFRFDEMFSQLVLPLRDRRSLSVEVDDAEETSTSYRKQIYDFAAIDVILLEGIYLLKRALRCHYDLSFWIECSFETALARAIARAQEGLSAEETMAAYRRIYFPAQEIHFARDEPRAAATATICNDPALGASRAPR